MTGARRCGFRRGRTAGRHCGCGRRGRRARGNGARGDQYVEMQVVVPKPADERVRNLMKELEKIDPEDPRKELFAKAGV